MEPRQNSRTPVDPWCHEALRGAGKSLEEGNLPQNSRTTLPGRGPCPASLRFPFFNIIKGKPGCAGSPQNSSANNLEMAGSPDCGADPPWIPSGSPSAPKQIPWSSPYIFSAVNTFFAYNSPRTHRVAHSHLQAATLLLHQVLDPPRKSAAKRLHVQVAVDLIAARFQT